jgi:hypothetical protein
MLFEEYKRSLKMPEVEEVLDLIFYRPVAFLFVKLIYRMPVTPNGITMLSLLSGLIAAWYFSIGVSQALVVGALWYATANILDCSDGQLARLQQSGTLLGRVVDGVIDYISSVAIFLGIGIGLSIAGSPQWIVVIIAGISSAIHAIMFDRYQNEFITVVRNEKNFHHREVERFTNEIQRMTAEHRDAGKVFFLKLYLSYLRIQKHSGPSDDTRFDPEFYKNKNLLMIRLWSFLGPTTNRTLLIVCALAGKVEYFLWIIILPANLWLVMCFLVQRKINRDLVTGSSYAG